MRPVFAIAPLALAFILLGPTEANSAATPSLIAKVWHMVFDRDVASPTGLRAAP